MQTFDQSIFGLYRAGARHATRKRCAGRRTSTSSSSRSRASRPPSDMARDEMAQRRRTHRPVDGAQKSRASELARSVASTLADAQLRNVATSAEREAGVGMVVDASRNRATERVRLHRRPAAARRRRDCPRTQLRARLLDREHPAEDVDRRSRICSRPRALDDARVAARVRANGARR